MRVLVLSQNYDPEPVAKPGELARSLASRGHQVTVVTGMPNYPTGRLYPGYGGRLFRVTTEEGVRVVRLALFPDQSRSALRRSASYLSFACLAALLGPLLSGPVDVLYVRHPPLSIGLAAWWIGLLRRARFLYAVHDLWPESVVAVGMLRRGFWIRVLEGLERFVYRRAGAVGVVSPAFVDSLLAKGVPREKVHLLTDWADEDLWWPEPADPEVSHRHGLDGRFHVVFAGNLGLAQGLDTVVAAADRLRKERDVRFVLIGDGADRERLDAEVRSRGLDNVRFLGRIPPAEVRRIAGASQLLLVHLKAGFLASVSQPSKLYAYLACERPVLAALDGPGSSLVEEIGAGLAVPADSPRKLAAAVLQLRATPEAERLAMGRRGREAFLARFSRSVGVAAHESVLAGLAGPLRDDRAAARSEPSRDAAG